MKKTLLYIAALGLLGFGVWFFLFRKTNPFNAARTPEGILEDAFQVKDTGNVGKIFLAQRGQPSSTLTRTEDGWMLDNTYPAASFMVEQLLTTMAQQSAKMPVPENLRDNVIRSLAGNAIKTEVYDRNGKLMKTFYVGGEAANLAGTFMMMEHAEKPYVVQIPLFNGYLTPRYEPGIKIWRDRRIMYAAQPDVVAAGVEYPASPINSFSIAKGADGQIAVNVSPAISSGKKADMHRAESYFSFFDKLYAVAYVNGDPGIDSILGTVPLRCTISLQTKDSKTQKALVYYMPLNRRSKNFAAEETPENDYDSDNAYAVVNDNKDTVVIQYQMFSKLFRSGAEFFTTTE